MTSIGRRLGALAFATGAAAFALAQAEAGTLDRARQDKTFRIAFREDAPPFSFSGPNGEPAGFMVDLCRSVAKHIADDLKIADIKVGYVPVTSSNRFDAITTGKADLLCEPTSETLSRREQVDFSITTFIDGASLVVAGDGPADFRALAGQKVGVLAGTTTEKGLSDTLAGAGIAAEVVPAKTHDEGLAMLAKGQSSPISAIGRSSPISPLGAPIPAGCASQTTISRSNPTLSRSPTATRISASRSTGR
jgi:ABC-type amino acid transport substrate-binding protein